MYYKDNTIQSRPNIPVTNPTDAEYKEYSWIPYDRNTPDYNPATQKTSKTEVVVKDDKAVQQWNVEPLSDKELQQRLQAKREQMEASRWRLMSVLEEMGMLDTVNQAVSQMPKTFQIAWNNANSITRLGKGMQMVQSELGLSDEQIDQIFEQAKQIEI